MTAIGSVRRRLTSRIRAQLHALDSRLAAMVRRTLHRSDSGTSPRIGNVERALAEKYHRVEVRLREAALADESAWGRTRQELEAAWIEYLEAVDRARHELERSDGPPEGAAAAHIPFHVPERRNRKTPATARAGRAAPSGTSPAL